MPALLVKDAAGRAVSRGQRQNPQGPSFPGRAATRRAQGRFLPPLTPPAGGIQCVGRPAPGHLRHDFIDFWQEAGLVCNVYMLFTLTVCARMKWVRKLKRVKHPSLFKTGWPAPIAAGYLRKPRFLHENHVYAKSMSYRLAHV